MNHAELINIGVVGCGYWGPNLIRNFSSLPNCRVKWACDVRPERLERIEQLYPGVRTTVHIDQVLDDPEVEAVAIATPVFTHFELGAKVLSAGKHTLIEKPMASSAEQCQELIEMAKERGLALMVGHTFIYAPAVRKIKALIDSGEIGDVLYISSRRLNLGLFQTDINVAWDLAPHDISIILYLLDVDPVSVNCQGKAHVTPHIEDVTNISLNFANGGFALIHNSWLDPNKVRLTTVVGSNKMIVYDDTQPLEKIKVFDKRVEGPRRYDTFGDFHYSYHYGDTNSPFVIHEEPLKVLCRHFLDTIVNGSRPDSDGVNGLRVVQILEAASRSLASNGSLVSVTTRRADR